MVTELPVAISASFALSGGIGMPYFFPVAISLSQSGASVGEGSASFPAKAGPAARMKSRVKRLHRMSLSLAACGMKSTFPLDRPARSPRVHPVTTNLRGLLELRPLLLGLATR